LSGLARVERLDLKPTPTALGKAGRGVRPERVLHLAAQAGVRYSLENPPLTSSRTVVGFANLLEACRKHPPQHLVYASSSSVYGANRKLPWSESDDVGQSDQPIRRDQEV
jgi:nucleoside-diphosphate-sugar epimerase